MSVISSGNKALLTELLNSLINENNFDYDKQEFDTFFTNTCKSFNENRHEYDSLQQINQQIIGTCFNFLKNKNYLKPQIFERTQKQLLEEQYDIRKMNNNQNRNRGGNGNFPPSNTIQLVHDNGQPYLQQDIRKKNMNEFDMKLKARQDNFNDTINVKAPASIDFSDQAHEGPMGNLNTIINQTLEDREKELDRITKQYTTENKNAEKWLKLNKNNSNDDSSNDDSSKNERIHNNTENNINNNTENTTSEYNNVIELKEPLSILKNSNSNIHSHLQQFQQQKQEKKVSFYGDSTNITSSFVDSEDNSMSTFTTSPNKDLNEKINLLSNDIRELKIMMLEIKDILNKNLKLN